MAGLINLKAIIQSLNLHNSNASDIDELFNQIKQQGVDQFLSQPNDIYTIMSSQVYLITRTLNYLFPKRIDATLIAIGGFGRKELYPHSDLDLLILINKHTAEIHVQIEKFMHALWGCKKRKIGHSVRTIEEVVEDVRTDMNFFTALLESRPIAGNIKNYRQIKDVISGHDLISKEDFFQQKYEEQQLRNYKFSSNLEPNIKNSQGNLRYTHTIRWLIFYCFELEKPNLMTAKGIITRDEFYVILSAHKTLSQFRYALHILANRDENRLLFEYQIKLAEIFSYTGDSHQKPVEQMMRHYYQCTFDIKAISKIIISAIAERLFVDDGEVAYRNLGDTPFRASNHLIDVKDSEAKMIDPEYIFEPFVRLSTNMNLKGMTSNCVRALIETANNSLPNYQNASENLKNKFISLFKSPYQLAKQLQSMLSLGILEAYISNIANIKARMQFDLFHVHTVDQHTIQVVQHMENIIHGSLNDKFPEIAQIYNKTYNQAVDKTYVLYIAAFFHDMGKGSGRDHSEYGAEIAKEFCIVHGLSRIESDLIEWLVLNHLQMNLIAQKKDITDMEVINKFAESADSSLKVDCLLLLTIADILGTNKDLWNDWKANLLLKLHRSTIQLLNSPSIEILEKNQQDEIKLKQQTVINRLQLDDEQKKQLLSFWNKWPESYFHYNTVGVIKWQIQNIGFDSTTVKKVIFLKYYHRLKQCMLTTYIPRVQHVFANIIQVIDNLNLSITDARVYLTEDNFLVGQFVIINTDGSNVSDSEFINYIQAEMKSNLSIISPIQTTRRKRHYIKNNIFNIETNVEISNPKNKDYSIITVTTVNDIGILIRIAQIFSRYSLRVIRAKINTIGEKVEDYFCVSTADDKQISSLEDQTKICQDIVDSLI